MGNHKNILFVLILGLTACGTSPIYRTTQGVNVYCQDIARCWSNAQTSAVLDAFIDATDNPNELRYLLSDGTYGISIIASNGFDCLGSDKRCSGQYHPSAQLLDVAYTPCIQDSSLGHELVHLYQIAYKRRSYATQEKAHAEKRYFPYSCWAEYPALDSQSDAQHIAFRACQKISLLVQVTTTVRKLKLCE